MEKLANYSGLIKVMTLYSLMHFSARGIVCLFRKKILYSTHLEKITVDSY